MPKKASVETTKKEIDIIKQEQQLAQLLQDEENPFCTAKTS